MSEFLTGAVIGHVIMHEVPLAFLGIVAICKACKKRWCKGHKSDI